MGRIRAFQDENAPLTDPAQVRRVIADTHSLTLRTAESLRSLVLFGPNCTKVESLPAGKVDPLVQLTLLARDQWAASDNENTKLGYFREMRAIYASVDDKTSAAILELSRALERQAEANQRDRHHADKMDLLRLKAGTEPTDAELEAASAS